MMCKAVRSRVELMVKAELGHFPEVNLSGYAVVLRKSY